MKGSIPGLPAAETLYDQLPDAVVAVDEQGRIRLVNRQAEEMLGYRGDDLLGEPVEHLVPEQYRPGHQAHRSDYHRTARVRPMGSGLDIRCRRADGSTFPADIALSPVRTDEGVFVVATLRDVTERRQAEEAVRESEERFRLLATERKRAQDRLEAASQVTAALLLGATRRQVLTLLARRARELVGADLATVVLPAVTVGSLVVEVADGVGAEAMVGELFNPESSLSGHVMETAETVVVADGAHDERMWQPVAARGDVGPALVAPIGAPGSVAGTLGVANLRGGRRFGDDDLEIVQLFAAQTALVLEFARGQEDRHRVALLEERDRIARDLHDLVIQRLFATGMSLQSLLRLAESRPVVDRVQQAVDDIDATIRDIRSTIFALQSASSGGVRARMLDLATEAADQLGFKPRLTFVGPVDSVVPAEVADHLLATAREALSNVARHAAATRVDVMLEAGASGLLLRVVDDGRGLPPGGRRSGLQNMADRARTLGGTLALITDEGDGTAVEWRVPLSEEVVSQ